MKDNQKSPAFPTKDYVRPNLNWECGHLGKGCPCRVGPSPKGECRATFECDPVLDVKSGETKGHWTCTRPKSGGGKCDNGPQPDGTCCNAIPKCQPRRTLRSLRKRITAFTIVATCLTLFIGISASQRDEFINPGPITSAHSSEHFTELHGDSSNCAACHDGVGQGDELWHSKAVNAFKDGLTPASLIKAGPVEASPMDENCVTCHVGSDFHQPNMVGEFACYTCHKEHETSGQMPAVTSSYCTDCHASTELMAASREKGMGADPHTFPSYTSGVDSDAKLHARERPKEGYTDVISAFHTDHPEFRLLRGLLKDGAEGPDKNSLKFNHAVHLVTGDIPKINGKDLDCTHCHQPDSRGEYLRPITYEQNCVDCHALQFDKETVGNKETPALVLPHGDPDYVRAFLRSLPIQYAEYARNHEGITLEDDLDAYVDRKEQGLSEQYSTGENLEQAVFFANMKGEIQGGGRASFAGCVTCHNVEVNKRDNAAPTIENVSVTDRWLTLGRFDHQMHSNVSCVDCHDVTKSELTSDLNLPSIKSCVECHSPEGGIDSRCTSCHNYHNHER